MRQLKFHQRGAGGVSGLWLQSDEVSWIGTNEDGDTVVHVAQDYRSPYRVIESESEARAQMADNEEST